MPSPIIDACNLPNGLTLELLRAGGAGKTPILCIPGLTRNVRDFANVIETFAATDREVIAMSLRGRSGSARAEMTSYTPTIYRDDALALLDTLGIDEAIFLGTSLGGITTMLAAEKAIDRIKAAIINDIGPELAPDGIMRIVKSMNAHGDGSRPRAGLQAPVSFDQAVEAIRGVNEVAFPGQDHAFWDAFARRTYRETASGQWVLDFDPQIGVALTQAPPTPDLWPGFKALAERPTLVIRGAISDLLTAEIVAEMRAAHPGFDYAEVANIGHAPMLDEPDAVAAIKSFLDKLA